MPAHRITATALALFIASLSTALARQQDRGPDAALDRAETCALETGPRRTVIGVVDGETLDLDDGTQLRLIGALAPRASDAETSPHTWPPEQATITALSSLVLGKSIQLAFGTIRKDRHGRTLAHAFVADGGQQLWVQGELLRRGLARAYGLPGSFDCWTELLAHEQAARAARTGLWRNAMYRTKRAEPGTGLMRFRNRFELVNGTVTTVAETRAASFVNFGADWRTDFTIRVAKSVRDQYPDFNRLLATLQGQTITVRGWIERRNGPMIELWHPGQLEVSPSAVAPAPVRRPADALDVSPGAGQDRQNPAGHDGGSPGSADL